MIKSFRDRETEKVFQRRFSQRLPNDIQSVALRKLRMPIGERLDHGGKCNVSRDTSQGTPGALRVRITWCA